MKNTGQRETFARNPIAFSLHDRTSVDAAVDCLLAGVGGNQVEMLGLGEPTHGIEEPLILRNAMFRRLVERHGFTAIAVESSFTRGWLVDAYVHDAVDGTTASVMDEGFSHGFGKPAGSRELVEWMRAFNTKKDSGEQVGFYGFDGPMEMMYTDSPRKLVGLALNAFRKLDVGASDIFKESMMMVMGEDAAWENLQANRDSNKSFGDSIQARALRAEVETLVSTVGEPRFNGADPAVVLEARHLAKAAAKFLDYHRAVATLGGDERFAGMLGMRDAMMGDNLEYIVARERLRGGRVMVFAHNSHLQRGIAQWQWGPQRIEWRPAGSFVGERLADHYAVIATVAGAVDGEGFDVAAAEAGTVEGALCALPGPVRGVLMRDAVTVEGSLVPRVVANSRYVPLSAGWLKDFDAIVAFDEAGLQRVD